MSIETSELFHKLCHTNNIQNFLEEYGSEFLSLSFTETINNLATEKDMSIADIARNSGQGDYVYKVFQGKRKPSRDIILAIAIGMKLSVDETQLLLRAAKLAALDPRDRRDSVLIYGLNEQMTFSNLNELLYEMQEQTL